MSFMLPYSITTISLALVFYTIGVWGEKLSGSLKPWNLTMFWIGLLFDTTGTTLMSIISESISLDLHSVSGVLAILLMLFHAIWATIVIVNKKKKAALLEKFHRFSIVVWVIWLVPYLTGVILNII